MNFGSPDTLERTGSPGEVQGNPGAASVLPAAGAPGWFGLALLAPAWVALAWLVSQASWFWRHNPDLQFGWMVLLLCGYLFWEAWEQRPALSVRWRGAATGLALPGLGLLFLTQLYQASYGLTPASMSGLATGALLIALANLHLVFGTAGLRRFGFAFGFILIAMPIPSVIHSPLVMGLQAKVAAVNVEVLNLVGIPAEQIGSAIRLPNCTVGIDEACSGVRSLQSAVMATLFIGYLTLRRTSLQAALFVTGVALAIFGNLVRSLFLSLTANARGADAIQNVHDPAGWSILAFTVCGVGLAAWWLGRVEKRLMASAPPAAR